MVFDIESQEGAKAHPVPDVFVFYLTSLVPKKRIEVRAECQFYGFLPWFADLLSEIAERWPGGILRVDTADDFPTKESQRQALATFKESFRRLGRKPDTDSASRLAAITKEVEEGLKTTSDNAAAVIDGGETTPESETKFSKLTVDKEAVLRRLWVDDSCNFEDIARAPELKGYTPDWLRKEGYRLGLPSRKKGRKPGR